MSEGDVPFRVITPEEAQHMREHGRAKCACGEWVLIRDADAMNAHRLHTEQSA